MEPLDRTLKGEIQKAHIEVLELVEKVLLILLEPLFQLVLKDQKLLLHPEAKVLTHSHRSVQYPDSGSPASKMETYFSVC